jgi:hypothetical protein
MKSSHHIDTPAAGDKDGTLYSSDDSTGTASVRAESGHFVIELDSVSLTLSLWFRQWLEALTLVSITFVRSVTPTVDSFQRSDAGPLRGPFVIS